MDHVFKMTRRDLGEIMVGGMALAFPVALTEEVWGLGEELSWPRILTLLIGSLFVLSWHAWHMHDGGEFKTHWRSYALRIAAVYLLTAGLCTLLLVLLDRWPILSDPDIALRRTVIVSFPAVFSAVIVDYMN